MNIVNVPTCPTLASSRLVGLDSDTLVSFWDCMAQNFSIFVSKAICRPARLKFRLFGPIVSMDSCSALVGALKLAQDSAARRFESATNSGTFSIVDPMHDPDP